MTGGATHSQPRRAPVPLPGPVLHVLRACYLLELGRRNRRFNRGEGVTRLEVPVLSVGNLSMGGTGKTPMVRRLVEWIRDGGGRPCIAMRGYGAKPGDSDEAQEYQDRLPGVPVVAQPDRLAGLRPLLASRDGPSCVVLDDGFQHRRIARSLDLVLLDASRDPFEDDVLPAGWLREPVSALARADATVITHAEAANPEQLAQMRERASEAGASAVAIARHAWTGLRLFTPDGEMAADEVTSLEQYTAVSCCAIGNPAPFLAECRRATRGRVLAEIVLRDHHPYDDAAVDRLVTAARDSRADVILVTAKDWAKLGRVSPERWPCPVVVPTLEMALEEGEQTLKPLVLDAAGLGG
ncbi:MAG: tetraacyldisaccharide 4'-kinase [Planctomycetota bacterium]